VQQYTDAAPNAENHPGNGTYTVGGVSADTKDDSGSLDQWAYAGWSLVIVYSSPDTAGHQLYLYDDFIYSNHTTDHTILDVDFDGDGSEGGTISGFMVPDQVEGETEAAHITVCGGEGDNVIFTGDTTSEQFKVNATALSDGYGATNVWNSKSEDVTYDGIDVDTYTVTWASGLLQAGDTSVEIDMTTQTDVWNLVYIILSFRSSTFTGDALSYLIEN